MSPVLRRAVPTTLALVLAVGAIVLLVPRPVAASGDTHGTLSPVQQAWNWIEQQRGTGTAVVGDSTITADSAYADDWTGAVGGTFTVQGTYPISTDAASVAVDSPAAVGDSYAGPVTGHVTVAPAPGRWIVQAYRVGATGSQQVALQALVAPDGTFRINLGDVAAPATGHWSLGLLDAQNAYAPYGTPWPAASHYRGLVVRELVTTDTTYVVGEQPARTDGTFGFADSRPGTKSFQLVDPSGPTVLAETAPDLGLVRSFAGSSRTYTYDQALAVITAAALGKDVSVLAAGLLRLQRPDGGFVESADVLAPAYAVPLVRTGISAIATYALLVATRHDPSAAVRAGAASGVQWLLSQRRGDGLIGAGYGDYRADGSFDASARPAWVSTEHDLDAWQALHLAATVLGDASLATAADELASAILARLWSTADARFVQGIHPDGSIDTADPLDVSSWGSLFLRSTGHAELAASALAHAAAFASTDAGASGFRAYYPQDAFRSAPADVWVEGSAGVALAQLRAGDTAAGAATLGGLASLQRADGSFPYATRADTATGMQTASSIASTCWFVLASTGTSSIWA